MGFVDTNKDENLGFNEDTDMDIAETSETYNFDEEPNTIDHEIANLEKIYRDTVKDIKDDMSLLKTQVKNYQEPKSSQILDKNLHWERTYLQNQMI